MSDQRDDFSDILIRDRVITAEQQAEAKQLARQAGLSLVESLVQLGHATADVVYQAMAEFHRVRFLELTEVTIPPAVIELLPESVARENVVLPIAVVEGWLIVAVCDPADFDLVQNLEFILNKNIRVVLAVREQIVEAIDRCYGESETESVDSMLSEFTDTAIDFTETAGASLEESEYELSLACGS